MLAYLLVLGNSENELPIFPTKKDEISRSLQLSGDHVRIEITGRNERKKLRSWERIFGSAGTTMTTGSLCLNLDQKNLEATLFTISFKMNGNKTFASSHVASYFKSFKAAFWKVH